VTPGPAPLSPHRRLAPEPNQIWASMAALSITDQTFSIFFA
jgi:hypothetical protein